MPRPGELTFFDVIGEELRIFAVNKPFSETDCGYELMQVGAIFTVLPPPPARILECGCGTGWLSYLLQRRGYDVVGVDVATTAIRLARDNPPFTRMNKVPRFDITDSEKLDFESEFDAVVFYDSLHHAVDEEAALRCAFRALKPGGVCITSEPGIGHEARSQRTIAQFDVTEKDMPPKHVVRLGRSVGFAKAEMHPRPDHIGRLLFNSNWPALGRKARLLRIWPLKYLAILYLMVFGKRNYGIAVLHKSAQVATVAVPTRQAA